MVMKNRLGKSAITVFLAVLLAGCLDISQPVTPSLQRIAVSPPNKTVYGTGEALDLSGLMVTGYYDDGTTASVSGYTLSWNDTDAADGSTVITAETGTKTVTVSYGGKTAEFVITVSAGNAATLTSIAVTSPPDKTAYIIGEALDLSGLAVTGHYDDGKTASVSGYTLSWNNADVADGSTVVTAETGTKTVTVSYGGKTAAFTVTVNTAALVSIAVTSPPDKTNYVTGETFDITGLVVTGTYSDNTTRQETVSLANVSGYNASTPGQQTLTVTINGKTAAFTVTVDAITLSGIEITALPGTITYDIGDELDLSGLAVTAVYSDGSGETVPITADNISGFDSSTAGEKTLTVTYGGKTVTFTVTVVLRNLTLRERLDMVNGTGTIVVNADDTLEPYTIPAGKTITLKGDDTEHTIQLTGNGSLFTVAQGASLILDENIILKGHGENTASLINVAGNLTLKKGAKISGNTKNLSAGSGGGVYVAGNSSFLMEGGEISGNNAQYSGGGVYVSGGSFILKAGVISGNTTREGGGGGGVAVFTSDGSFVMEGGEIANNTALNGTGGGVYYFSNNEPFVMKGGKITNNTVSNAGSEYGGGGIYMSAGSFFMEGGEISGNTVYGYNASGGGVCFGWYTGNFIMKNGAKIVNNSASGEGGGGYGGGVAFLNYYGHYDDTSFFTMEDSEISGNTAYKQGGGVYLYNYPGTFTMARSKIADNTLKIPDNQVSGDFWGGSGVCLINSPGAVFAMEDGSVVTGNTHFYGSSNKVGSICINGKSTFIMKNGTKITQNDDDGLMFFNGGSFVHEANTEISDNTGCGIAVFGDSAISMQAGCKITGNNGRGVTIFDGAFVMDGGEISGNSTYNVTGVSLFDPYGGGVLVAGNSESSFVMNGGEISGNTAVSRGGGVYVDSTGVFVLKGGEISGNTAPAGGGGVSVSGIFNPQGGTMAGNTAGNGWGNQVLINSSDIGEGRLRLGGADRINTGTPGDVAVEFYVDSFIRYWGRLDIASPLTGTSPVVALDFVGPVFVNVLLVSGGTAADYAKIHLRDSYFYLDDDGYLRKTNP
jgi:hypothetical protein